MIGDRPPYTPRTACCFERVQVLEIRKKFVVHICPKCKKKTKYKLNVI